MVNVVYIRVMACGIELRVGINTPGIPPLERISEQETATRQHTTATKQARYIASIVHRH